MAGKPGSIPIDVPQHIIQRGYGQASSFYGDRDYLRYLENLRIAATANVAIHAYVLRCNHIHLLVSPLHTDAVVQMLQTTRMLCDQNIKPACRPEYSLWNGGFKAIVLDSEDYMLSCMRYIEANPVSAGIIRTPEKYPWSSYHANANGRHDPLLEPHPVYGELGSSRFQRQYAYRKSFLTGADHSLIHQKREAINQERILVQKAYAVRNESAIVRTVQEARQRISPQDESDGSFHLL